MSTGPANPSARVGYLAVPSDEADDILRNGYVCSEVIGKRQPPSGRETCHTSRDHVPFCGDRVQASMVMRRYRASVQYVTILEICRMSPDGEREIPGRVELDSGSESRGHIVGLPGCVLPPEFLTEGVILERGVSDYANAPCPFCRNPLPGLESQRGKVGMATLFEDAFVVVPCPEESCRQEQIQRQRRLSSRTEILYHACSRATWDLIRRCGNKLIRGKDGRGGGGIYFAHTPRETEWKAECVVGGGTTLLRQAVDAGLAEYVVLKCSVNMGRVFEAPRDRSDMTFAAAVSEPGGPFDSVILDRGGTGYPVPAAPVRGTRAEEVPPGGNIHPGYEFVVYSWDQVTVIGEVDRDPVPPAFQQ